MCPRRKVQNAASVLRGTALTWWESLRPLDKRQTWNDMKIVMRENFVNPSLVINSNDEMNHLEEESTVIPLAMPNLLQDNVHKQEDDMEDHEELTTSCANSEPSLHNTPINPAEDIGAHGATLMEGENSLDVLIFSTNHAMMEQILVEPSLDLSLSHDDFLDAPCDNDELCDNAYVLHDLEPNTCAEINHIIHIASTNYELKLLSSLNTLCYIDFDVLCNLSCLEEKLFAYANFPWLSRHTYHAFGKYNIKGDYMIHRVYICANLNSPFVVQHCDHIEDYNIYNFVLSGASNFSLKSQVQSKEGEHTFLVSTNLL